MIRRACRRVAPAFGLLSAALVLATPAPARPPMHARGMPMPAMHHAMMPPPMHSPMTMAAGTPAPHTTSSMGHMSYPLSMGMGMNRDGYRSPSSYPHSANGYPWHPTPYGYGFGQGGGSSGGGSGAAPSLGPPDLPDSLSVLYTPALASAWAVRGGPRLELLNAAGELDWPLALRILPPGAEARDLRQRIDSRAGEIQRQAAEGPVDADLLREMNRDVDRLREMLADKADSLPVSEQATTDAWQFLRKLRAALKAVP